MMNSTLPTRPRRSAPAPPAYDGGEAASISSESDGGLFSEPSMDGMEHISSTRPARNESTQVVPYRNLEALQIKSNLLDDFSNKTLPPESMDLLLQRMEKRADVRRIRSYHFGLQMDAVDENAPVLRVGLSFLAGADLPQVARSEQTGMTATEPHQMDASWRVNTAATLLMQVDIAEDLLVVRRDQTAQIAQKAVERKRATEALLRKTSSPRRSTKTPLPVPELEKVTIDSNEVQIVNNLCGGGDWDIECTLIEVDMQALCSLVYNYKFLIQSAGGPDMSFQRTRELLDTMIEDARLLCVRSPILFRMSTRSHIIYSKNTRYGINVGHTFQTLTTSQGIREIISISASYYNSLDPTGSKDTNQKSIKPRFLQMIVLLLSLLNDTDLKELKGFLEATYGLKADRPDIELLFLKVIPLMSINSKVFLKAMVPALEGHPLLHNPNTNESHYWEVFIQRILKLGYLLPGTISDLGHERLSWIVKWPEEGFKSSIAFNHLQYHGCHLRAINDIPPIEFHPEAYQKEVTIELTNGAKFMIGPSDLEMVTCLNPGVYTVWEARAGGRSYDLEVQEAHLNKTLQDAIRGLNEIIHHVNTLLANPKNRNSIIPRNFLSKSKSELAIYADFKGSGRCTRCMVLLNHDILAMAYKVEGRKVGRRAAIRSMATDIHSLSCLVSHYERHTSDVNGRVYSREKRDLKASLDFLKQQLAVADEDRKRMGDGDPISEEPIAKVIYPGNATTGNQSIWNEYTAWFTEGNNLFHVEAQHLTVLSVNWLSNDVVEVRLHQHQSKFYVTPIVSVEEGDRDSEIQADDAVLLMGQYMVVAERDYGCDNPGIGYLMTNYLKITSVEAEAQRPQPKRGMNRTRVSENAARVASCVFR